MLQREVLINNPAGLHARPASLLVAQAAKSKSEISIRFNNKTINAKSILSVLAGGIRSGSQIVVTADGEDEREALDAICALIEQLMNRR